MGIKNNRYFMELFLGAPRVGIEPTTVALTERRSTAELPGNIKLRAI